MVPNLEGMKIPYGEGIFTLPRGTRLPQYFFYYCISKSRKNYILGMFFEFPLEKKKIPSTKGIFPAESIPYLEGKSGAIPF